MLLLPGLAATVHTRDNCSVFHSQAVERSSSSTSDGQKITFNMIKSRLGDLMYKITAQKFEDPADGEDKVRVFLIGQHATSNSSDVLPRPPSALCLLHNLTLPSPLLKFSGTCMSRRACPFNLPLNMADSDPADRRVVLPLLSGPSKAERVERGDQGTVQEPGGERALKVGLAQWSSKAGVLFKCTGYHQWRGQQENSNV